MLNKPLILLFVLLFSPLYLISTHLIGQTLPYKSKQYTVQDGLPGRLVLDIVKDENGLIWLATNKGLSRFDGYEFINFNNYDYSLGIEDRSFNMSLATTHSGHLALSHGYQALTFELFNLTSFKIEQPDSTTRLYTSPPAHVFTDKNGMTFLTFSNKQGIKVFQLLPNFGLKEVLSLEIGTDNLNRKVNLFVGNTGDYWLTLSDTGVFLFNSDGQLKKRFTTTDFEHKIHTGYEIVFFHQDAQNRIWATFKEETGVFLYNEQLASFKKSFLGTTKNEYYSKLWEDEKGNLLFKISPHLQSAKMQDLLCLKNDGSVVSFDYLNKALRYVFEIEGSDFFEMMLAGTPTGLKVITQNRQTFEKVLQEEIQPGEWGMIIRGIVADSEKNVYFGAENGRLFVLKNETKEVEELPISLFKHLRPNKTYAGGRSIYLDQNQNIWSSGSDSDKESYLHKYNIQTKQTETIKLPDLIENYYFDGTRYFYLSQTNQHGTNAKLVIYDLVTKKSTLWLDNFAKNPLSGTMSRCLSPVKDGILWIGTINGLLKINIHKKEFKQISLKNEAGQLLDNQEIIAVTPVENGLWLGTNNGFLFLDSSDELIKEAYSTQDGLVSKSVCGIMVDKQENLWLSTFFGLSHFNRKEKTFQNFYQKDGLSHFEFNRMGFYQDGQGKYYFGSMNGVTAFNSENVLRETKENLLVPTRIIKSYADRDSQEIQMSGFDANIPQIIKPNYAFFEVHFALPNSLSDGIRYSAWLENYEQDWNFLGTTPKVRYSKLPAGEYQLHIKAVDAKGNPSKNVLNLPISVKEVFYKQTWFHLLVFSILGGILWFILQYNANQKLKVEQLRTKLSSDLHDEVSGLLAGIAMQSDLVQMSVEKEKAKNQLQKIADTSRSAMSRMSDVIWSIDARKDKMSDLLLRMQEHAAEILMPLNIDYQFDIDTFNTNKAIGLNLRQNLYLIFTEVINNIAKHSDADTVQIALKNQGNAFLLHIKDNGTAKEEKAGKKTGQGLSNLKMRSKSINGDLTIVRDNGYEVKLKVKRFA